uniref:Putative serine/threonine-protein kinase (LMTK1) n=1 Tax=Heliconius melpomene TaxID=34740 RepID=D0AB79_HELME|nr:putative serine/threonine-protein kinase (LMTK1) [Heliconius melpomene]
MDMASGGGTLASELKVELIFKRAHSKNKISGQITMLNSATQYAKTRKSTESIRGSVLALGSLCLKKYMIPSQALLTYCCTYYYCTFNSRLFSLAAAGRRSRQSVLLLFLYLSVFVFFGASKKLEKLFTASVTHLHDARRSQPPDSGFSEPVNNNISEDNNNGPISLREMQNIANNNATAYIVSENEERNRISRDSVVEFEPLPSGIRVVDPLERCADWFVPIEKEPLTARSRYFTKPKSLSTHLPKTAGEDFPRNQLQYLREIDRGWFGRVVVGEIEDGPSTSTVAVKILNQNASLEDKARFLDEARLYRDMNHENILGFVAKCLQEDPWILIFELCSLDLHQYLTTNRPKMAILNESGVPLQLMCDVTSALAHMHSRGFLYGYLWSGNVLIRGTDNPRAVIGHYSRSEPQHNYQAPEIIRNQPVYTVSIYKLASRYEHVAIIHAPSTSMTSNFSDFRGSDEDFDNGHTIQDSLSVEMDTAVSRSSSIMSDRDPLSIQIKSESLTNLHGSLEDVRNIYLTHNETPALECHQGNINLEDKEKEQDRSDSSVDPWLKDIITDSQDDVSYYKDVSDVIKNLDNILNSEKTSSSESSHQASPSRDNLSLECKKDYPMQTSMVKSPGISNFQNILDTGFDSKSETEPCDDDELDRDTVGTLSHSFERHSDSLSQQTLENITPETPIKDLDISNNISKETDIEQNIRKINVFNIHSDLPKESSVDSSDSNVPKLKELCVASMPSVSNEQVILKQDCQTSYDNKFTDSRTSTDTKSVDISTAFISNEIGYIENQYFMPTQNEEQTEDMNKFSSDTNLPVEFASIPKEPLNSLVRQSIFNENEPIKCLKEESLATEDNPQDEVINDISIIHEKNEPVLSYQEVTDYLETEEIVVDRVPDILFDDKHNVSERKTFQSDIKIPSKDIKNCPSDKSLPSPSPMRFEETKSSMINDVPSMSSSTVEKNIKENNVVSNNDISADIVESKINNDHMIMIRDTIQQEDISLMKHHISDNKKHVRDEIISEDSISLVIKDLNELEELNKSQLQENNQSISIKSEKVADSFKDINVNVSFERYDEQIGNMDVVTNHLESIETTEQPETVQNYIEVSREVSLLDVNIDLQSLEARPEEVQSSDDNVGSISQAESSIVEDVTYRLDEITKSRSDANEVGTVKPNDTTIYMDLINDTDSKILKDSSVDENVKYIIQSCLETSNSEAPCDLTKNESTVYLDLPSIIKENSDFLNTEKSISSRHIEVKDNICTSTPKGSDPSHENTLEAQENTELSETKVPEYTTGSLMKQEQRCITENISPFESPSKSHHTDTYDENSSVVLGPFEHCSLELFKTIKSVPELTDLPKEELLAFSLHFSEINLETPSPLCDGNFLNEVPDIIPDEMHFDEIATLSEAKPESQTPINTDETDEQSSTEKRVSPLTPPNSPGNFLASTSQQKYVVDRNLDANDSKNEVVDLNQIDLQMTTKLAMADNENNMNIEYSGPLTEEGITLNDSMLRDNDALPESYLAGNGGSVEDVGEDLVIDEERMKELRNELELKLPLAQVAGIEPPLPVEADWSELPPPPELMFTYGALSPIAEETKMQLNAYENDDQWNISIRTESSASYPEPCNNSTDEVTDLPTGANAPYQHSHSTYTIQSKENSFNHTFTIHKEGLSSKEITMSADSLNASPLKKIPEIQSPIDDKTYTKNDEEKESICERLSQVSPFLLSPTTDTSAPEISDNALGVSTFSKTTVPTDAKSSKPSETQCLSKATSIDLWCSNDTLYNVEENFDDLVVDPDCPMDFEEKDKSESEDTLTHNDDEKEVSHCSTYIVHDSKSEVCETFSPDSITANDNYTYTKLKTDVVTPSVVTKSDLNDSTKSQTKDLAYCTLMSGLPSYSNCTMELASGMEDPWKLPQPELVRKFPIGDEFHFTPPKQLEKKEFSAIESPQTSESRLKKMESVDMSCLTDNSGEITKNEDSPVAVEVNNSPNLHFRNMALPVTSTPLFDTVQDGENIEPVPLELPQTKVDTSNCFSNNVPNLQMFFQPAEIRTQDISSNLSNEASSEILLEEDSKMLNSHQTTDISINKTPIYSDFESSAVTKPQDIHSKETSSQSVESENIEPIPLELPQTKVDTSDCIPNNVPNFQMFFQSAEIRPQDILSNLSNGASSEILLEGDSKTLSCHQTTVISVNKTPTYSDFESSAKTQPQDIHSKEKSSQTVESENIEPILLELPQTKVDTSDCISNNVPNFQMFYQSAEIRPQDISSNLSNGASSEILLEGDNKTLSCHQTTDISVNKTPTYSDFESSAVTKPQDIHSKETSSQSVESETSSENFRNFESSVKSRPQDLSSLIDASSLLLKSERRSSELLTVITNSELETTSHFDSHMVTQPESLILSPNIRNLFESQTVLYTDLDREDETEQPHSIIITEIPLIASKLSPNRTFDSHTKVNRTDVNSTYDSHASGYQSKNVWQTENTNAEKINGHSKEDLILDFLENENRENPNSIIESAAVELVGSMQDNKEIENKATKEPIVSLTEQKALDTLCNGTNELFATVNFLNETFEELVESNVDDNDIGLPDKDEQKVNSEKSIEMESKSTKNLVGSSKSKEETTDKSDVSVVKEEKQLASVTNDFLQNEKKYCQRDSFFPLLSDIRFTDSGSQPSATDEGAGEGDAPSSGQDSGSGSEGDEVEFVPSSWDCSATPSKSSLRSLEQPQDNKKHVVFKRQKYHCVYEYPREAPDLDADSPAYLPDFSTYTDWDPSSAEDAELGYGQLLGALNPHDLFPLRAGIAFGADYDEDFFISSSARPFESLGVMSTTSQFFPGMHIKPSLDRDFSDELSEEFPPPPSPLPTPTIIPTTTALSQTRSPSLDFTTPDSGVEDITPGSITDDDYKKKLLDSDTTSWRSIDSASSSESVSPSSPGGEALGGLRHTRDKLKLDLPPSPHIPSPRHNRVFNFVLDKPKRREEKEVTTTPLVMTDDTPIITMSLSTTEEAEDIMPEPTFSTFGKTNAKPQQNTEPETNIILTDDIQEPETEVKEDNQKVEPVKGEGTVLDSGDEDSGIESSSKATLERKPASNMS